MKQGWEIKKLGEVCNFSQGIQVPIEEQHTICEEGMIRFLRIIDFTQNGEAPRYINNVDERYILRDKEIAIVRYGTPGYVCYGKKGAIANNLFKVLPKKDTFDFSFLKYWLSSEAFQSVVKGNQYGAALKAIKFSTINEILIPVPPLPEQEKIVAELDCLSGILEKKRQQLKELDALAQAIFYEMFGDPVTNEKGWEVFPIECLCSSIVRGPFGSALKKEFFIEPNPTAYKVYEQKHAIQKSATIGTYYISAEKFETLSRFEVREGDIIMSCSGTIGEFFEIPIGAEKGLMNQALLKFTLNSLIEKTYFLYVMEWVKDNFDKKGTGLQNIGSVGTIKKTQISLPPLSLQQSFAKKIESIEKQKELIKQSIAEVETLFNSRMDYYFN